MQNIKRLEKITDKHVEINERLLMKLLEMYYKNPRFKNRDGKVDFLCQALNNANKCCQNVRIKDWKMRKPFMSRVAPTVVETKDLNEKLEVLVELTKLQQELIQESQQTPPTSPRKKSLENSMRENSLRQKKTIDQLINVTTHGGPSPLKPRVSPVKQIIENIADQIVQKSPMAYRALHDPQTLKNLAKKVVNAAERFSPKSKRTFQELQAIENIAQQVLIAKLSSPSKTGKTNPSGFHSAENPANITSISPPFKNLPKIITTPPESPINATRLHLKPPSPGQMQTSTPMRAVQRNLETSFIVNFAPDQQINQITSDSAFEVEDIKGVKEMLESFLTAMGEDSNKSITVSSVAMNVAPGKYDIYKMKQ